MASLDQILERMTERGAERLVLRVGEVPLVRTSGRNVPVQKVALSEAQVLALALELAGPGTAAQIEQRQPVSLTYRDFDVHVTFPRDQAAVDVVPADPLALPDDLAPVPSLLVTPPVTEARAPEAGSRITFEPDDDARHAPIDLDSSRPTALSSGVSAPAPGPPVPQPPSPAAGAAAAGDVRMNVTPFPVAPPGGFLDDVRSLVDTKRARYIALGALGAVAAVVLAGLLWWSRPASLPNVVMADASGHPVTFDDMRGPHSRMLVVFLLPGCSMSKFALDTLKDVYPQRAEKMAFVGLLFGSQADAERFAKDQQVPFPVYGIKDNKDPFRLQELMKKVGTSDWMVNGIYGGTTVVIDERNRVVLKLEKEGVRDLPAKLASLGD